MQMLDRPFYDRSLVFTLFHQQLRETKDESGWERALYRFRTSHGEANYRGLLSTLARASTFPQSQRDEYREKSKQTADAILGGFSRGSIRSSRPSWTRSISGSREN